MISVLLHACVAMLAALAGEMAGKCDTYIEDLVLATDMRY